MNEHEFEKHLNKETCPVRQVLSTIGDKWSMLVLILLGGKGKSRFNEIAKELDNISPKMLSQTLRSLESYGLVHKTIYPEVPPKVEYELTELSTTLLPHILALSDWVVENISSIQQKQYP